jgi:hypothetical protein
MTANLRTLTMEKTELLMKRFLMPVTALAAMKKIALAILSATLFMLMAAPAWADACSATEGLPSCGVTITITGTTGNLSATITVVGSPYDGQDDWLIGITNNSSVNVGTIILSGSSNLFAFDGDGACTTYQPFSCGPSGYEGPNNTFVGISPDKTTGKVLFTTPLAANGGTTWFSLEDLPTSVVAIGENKALTAGSTTTFAFGPFTCSSSENVTTCREASLQDDMQITPLNSASGDTLTFTAVSGIPAGPLGLDSWGAGNFGDETPPASPPGQLRFSATNFSNLACVPYADFSTSGNPVCVELELDCPNANTDACQFVYTMQNGFDIDARSLPNGIGGAALLVQHGVDCPTTGFTQNIFLSYTGSALSGSDPIKGSGLGTSCYAVAFAPTATPVAVGTTVSSFTGFEFPVLDTPHINPIVPLEFLNWDYNNSLGLPVTNLHLCTNSNGTGCTTPWIYLSLTALSSTAACRSVASSSSPLPSFLNSGLLNFGHGEYQFVWNTLTPVHHLTGCRVSVVLQFDSGLVVAPAIFIYP